MKIVTIGFTRSSAEHFFERLRDAGVTRIVDVRLNNVSQLAGFSKYPDIDYLARVVLGAAYEHDLRLAPTQDLLDGYRKLKRGWDFYRSGYLALMKERNIPAALDRSAYEDNVTALLCTEPSFETCHRRLVAEALEREWAAAIQHI